MMIHKYHANSDNKFRKNTAFDLEFRKQVQTEMVDSLKIHIRSKFVVLPFVLLIMLTV